MIPEGWKETTVGEAYQICNNLRLPINVEERREMKGLYRYYGPTGVLDFINEYRLDGEYALIGEDGDHFLKYDERPMTLLVRGQFNVNNHAHIISGTANCQISWFYYYFMHRPLTSYLTRQGAGRYKLNKATLEKIPVLIPPISEQCKIAEILNTWDKAIALLEQLITAKRKLKQGLMQQLLTGKKRFKEFEGVEWKKVTFQDVLLIEIGGTPSRGNANYWDNEKLTLNYWLSIADLKEKYITETKERITELGIRKSNTKLFPSETVVMSFKLTIGRAAILKQPMFTNEAICSLIPKYDGLIDTEFLYQIISIIDFEQEIDQAVKGKTLNKEKIKRLKFNLPSLPEQQKIASILSVADTEISNLEKQLAAYKKQKCGLMQQLLTGKKRVKIDESQMQKV